MNHSNIVSDLRRDYKHSELLESSLLENPFSQFSKWFDEALQSEVLEPNAMTLATVNEEGQPSARIVLLKGYDENGFSFFTNYLSHKGAQIASNPKVALVFCWLELERQIRIEGVVTKLSEEESDQYFYSRPQKSQIGAIASPQSQVIPSREIIENNFATLDSQLTNGDTLKRPTHWGGYRVIPNLIEFWQGRSSRLHDRLRYTLNKDTSTWNIERLAP